MADRRALISMLEDSGSIRLHDPKGHIRYKLPNGIMFYCSGTPSDCRSYANGMAALRRQLKHTHPEIATRGRNLPKNKRHTSNTIGDMAALKGITLLSPVSASSAIPGSQPIEAEFELLAPEPEPIEAPIPIHRAPRMKHEPPPPPSKPKTLTSTQLEEANHILHVDGNAAMNAYLSQCRTGMVEVTAAVVAERFQESIIAPENRVPENNQYSEDKEMASVLERTRQELQLTTERLSGYESQIAEIKAKQETDLIRQIQLTEYVTKHEALANEAAAILSILPPAPQPVEMPKPQAVEKKRDNGKGKFNKLAYGMAEFRQKVYPILQRLDVKVFDMDDVMKAIEEANFPGPSAMRAQILTWFHNELRKPGCIVKKVGVGRFAFIETQSKKKLAFG